MASGIKLVVNDKLLVKNLDSLDRQLRAAAETVQKINGRAEVIAAKRPKLAFEGAQAKRKKTAARAAHKRFLRGIGYSASRATQATKEKFGRSKKIGGVHGRLIWFYLKKKGKDPEKIPDAQTKAIAKWMNDTTSRWIERSYAKGRSEHKKMEFALTVTARKMAEAVVANIEKGGLGKNKGQWAKKKKKLIKDGYGIKKYGDQTVGVWTGRFIKAIKHRWRHGKRPGSK